MRTRIVASVLLWAVVSVVPVVAADREFPDDFTRLLIPVTAAVVPGANGSMWSTEWTVFNGSAERLFVDGPFPYVNLAPVIQDNDVNVGATKRLFLNAPDPGFDGAFVWVPTELLNVIPMTLRVRDTSAHAESYGASVPIVRAEDFAPRQFLIDVPTDDAYRATLRIYSSSSEEQAVRVRVWEPGEAEAIEDFLVVLRRQNVQPSESEEYRPSYVQLNPVSAAARASGAKVRLELTAVEQGSGAVPFWSFVSITHNETQHVTTILPR